jgi:uncharacterized RDD family membrane protein YckC
VPATPGESGVSPQEVPPDGPARIRRLSGFMLTRHLPGVRLCSVGQGGLAPDPAEEPSTVGESSAETHRSDSVLLPSHRRRIEAFAIDVVVVGVVFGLALLLDKVSGLPTLGLVAVAIAGWLYYVGSTAWLMDGQTAGKVICGLRVRRLGTVSVEHTPRGLLWSLGRHSVGYVVVDVFLVGSLLALVDRRRRCLHDYAFASEVTQAEADTGAPASFAGRYRSYWELFSDRYDEFTTRNRWFFFPWKWLSKGLIVFAVLLDRANAALGAEHAPSAVPAGTAKVLSFKAAAGVWAATIVTTGAIVAAAPWPSDPGVIDISGSWELSTIQVIENKYVADPPSLQGERLVFERDGDTFLITQGPELLRGTAVSPEKVTGEEILARSERTGRADCLGSSGEGATEGIYAETASWEFMRTGAPGEDDDQPASIEFRYVIVREMDTEDAVPDECPDEARFEATGTAALLSRP